MNERTDGERTGETLSTADLAYGQRDHEVERQDEHAREATGTADNARASVEAEPLFAADDARGYQQRWQDIQTRFVDEPKDSVRGADSLVAEVVQKLTVRFAEEREGLDHQWSTGSEVSTEDLRQALQHYRSFFQRLLSA